MLPALVLNLRGRTSHAGDAERLVLDGSGEGAGMERGVAVPRIGCPVQAGRPMCLQLGEQPQQGQRSRHGVQIDRGWETVLRDEKVLWDVMIESLADRLALVPLSPEVVSDGMPTVDRLAAYSASWQITTIFVLRQRGPLRGDSATSQWLLDPACGVHGVILAHDLRRQRANRVAAVCLQLADAKQRQLGIAEMFTDEQAAGGRRQAAKSV